MNINNPTFWLLITSNILFMFNCLHKNRKIKQLKEKFINELEWSVMNKVHLFSSKREVEQLKGKIQALEETNSFLNRKIQSLEETNSFLNRIINNSRINQE